MATPRPAAGGLSSDELMEMVEAQRAQRASGKVPVPPATREPAFTESFESERDKLERQALEKQIEGIDIFTPTGAAVAEEKMEDIREVTRVPRTPTGERAGLDVSVDPVTALAGATVEYFGLEPIVEAMKPQTIMSAAETEAAERQFQDDISRYYNQYLNKIEAQELSLPPQFKTYDDFLNAAMTSAGRELFQKEFEKAGGPRGETLIRPIEEGLGAAQQKIGIAAGDLFTTEEDGVIKENLVATGLRDLLIAETGVTALGQELISKLDDSIVEDQPVVRRWADNQRRAEGIEQLTADTVETALNAAGVSEESRQGLVDAAWWAGLAGSMALPLDMYITDVAKLGVKGSAAAVNKVIPRLTKGLKGADPVASFLATKSLADAAKLDPSDVRMQYASSLSKTETPQAIANSILEGTPLTKKQSEFILPEKVRGGQEASVGFGMFAGRGLMTPKFVSSTTRAVGIKEAASRAVTRYALGGAPFAAEDATNTLIREKLKAIVNSPPDQIDNILAATPERLGLPPLSDKLQANIADGVIKSVLKDEIALEVSTNAIRLRFEEGLAQLPDNYTLVTSNFALPKEQIAALYKEARANPFFVKAREGATDVELLRTLISGEIGQTATRNLRTLIDNGEGTIARSIMNSIVLESIAREMFGANVITSSDLLRISQKAVERADPKTLRRIEDMFTPDELKKTGFAKIVRDSTDFFGKLENPVINRLNNELNARLANLDDEVITKVEQKHATGQAYIVSLAKYLSEDLGIMNEIFTEKFLFANLGVVDDVGTAYSSAGGARGSTLMSKQGPHGELLEQVFNMYDEPAGLLRQQVNKLNQLNITSPEYWQALEEATTVLAGRKLSEVLSPEELRELSDKVRVQMLESDARFTFDPTKQGENIAGTTLSIARETAIKAHGLKVEALFPSVFRTKVSLQSGVSKAEADISDAMTAFVKSPYYSNIKRLYEGRTDVIKLEQGVGAGDTIASDLDTFFFQLGRYVSSPAESRTFALNILENVLKDKFLIQLGAPPTYTEAYLRKLMDRETLFPSVGETPGGFRAGAVVSVKVAEGEVKTSVLAELAAGYFLFTGVGDDIFKSLSISKPFGQMSAQSVGNYFGAYETLIDDVLNVAKKAPKERPDMPFQVRQLYGRIIGEDLLSPEVRAQIEAEEAAARSQVRNIFSRQAPEEVDPIQDLIDSDGVPIREELPEDAMTVEESLALRGPRPQPVPGEPGAFSMPAIEYATRQAMDADAAVRLVETSKQISTLLAASPIDAALSIPFDIVAGKMELGKGVKKEVTENYKTLIEFQRVNELFEAPGVTKDFEELAKNVKKNLETAKKNLQNQPDAVGTRATTLMSEAAGWLNYGWDIAGAMTRNTVLGGTIVPNIPHHVMNIMSAPSIMISTLGLGRTLKTFGNPNNLVVAAKVGSTLFTNKMVPMGLGSKLMPNPNGVAIITKQGVPYTYGELSDIILQSGISATVTTTEFRTKVFEELVSWTGQNILAPTKAAGKKSDLIRPVLKDIGERLGVLDKPSVFQDFANASDMFFRTAVLVKALNEGLPVDQAVRLARESMFDYGSIPKPLKDTLSKGFWLWSFRFLNDAKFVGNLLNAPNRLRQGYKLKKSGYDYTNEEDETYFPFIARYGDDRMWLSLSEDPEARRRYALMGPQVPMLSAAEDIFGLTQGFVAAATGLTQMMAGDPAGAEKLIQQVAEPGTTAALGIVNPVVEYLFINLGMGKEIAFGKLQDPGGYITPDLIHFYSLNGRFEEFVAMYDIQRVEPRPGKPTWGGFEYRVNPKNGKAKAAMSRLENYSIITGQTTYRGMMADINALTDPDFVDPRTEGLSFLGQLADRLSIIKSLDVPTKREMEEAALRGMKGELE